jgi:CheY-like chemotaxis protein
LCVVVGEEALQKLKAAKFKFDVVFVDENLSMNDGLYGHELVQVMRDSFNMQLTVICACTGNPTKVGKELMDAGVDIVWPKPPPSAIEIREKINVLLTQRWQMHSSLQTATLAATAAATAAAKRSLELNHTNSNSGEEDIELINS